MAMMMTGTEKILLWLEKSLNPKTKQNKKYDLPAK